MFCTVRPCMASCICTHVPGNTGRGFVSTHDENWSTISLVEVNVHEMATAAE